MTGGATATALSLRSLDETPTWALAAVCLVLVAISIVLEHLIDLLTTWLKRRGKSGLMEAVQKLKSGGCYYITTLSYFSSLGVNFYGDYKFGWFAELMVMGFMSLLLAATQKPISKICISTRVADKMLPCQKLHETVKFGKFEGVLWKPKRQLAEDVDDGDNGEVYDTDHCSSKGMVSIMSQEGIHQLHIFIFVMAMVHVIYSALIMALGRAKMKRWKSWEKETQSTEYQVANDPNRFRIMKQTTFARRHMTSLSRTALFLWIKCFFRQFFRSVAKIDYFTLRHGFIAKHLNTNTFNFQKYIQRSLEDDFKVVIGISPPLWFIVVIFLLMNVHGFHLYLWISFAPLVIVLALGTKLEIVLARMAIKLEEQNTVIKGALVVQPNDGLFWFGHPKFVLHFLHVTVFLCAFELAFFVWTAIEFGFDSCYHENTATIVTRLVLSVAVQFLCSYITLPLYALVTQMGSQYKRAVLEAQTANALRQWHTDVRKRQQKKDKQEESQPDPSTSHDYIEQENRNEINSSGQDFYTRQHRHSFILTEMVDISKKEETTYQGEITEEEIVCIDHRVWCAPTL
ncbi:hypothetical protein GIB67_002059 [Kingdonia uniflora]|uniref:MLO-like protein n=1 Tax=Kingdonia uniflora TaxID=39325 RepID=A0A7J7KWE8_9MAGN|nr:hypothetical protein GIB67_002059 [Kingdonia uniflora]